MVRPPAFLRALSRKFPNRDIAALERMRARGSNLVVLQPWTFSTEDRYPALFDALAERLAHSPEPRVLSFGCAGGEEVRALRRRLPHATVVGVDVNPRALDRARRRDRDPRSRYLIGDRPPPGEPFHAVLALAVFRHGALERNHISSSAELMPFGRAAEAFARLDAALKPGGVLAWGNAHVRLADLPNGGSYVLEAAFDAPAPSCWLYAPDNRLLAGASEAGGLYRKRA